MEYKIDTTNPNIITYITEELGFTILGGIRMDGLDCYGKNKSNFLFFQAAILVLST